MIRTLMWAPIVALVIGAGLWGARLGYVAVTITETDVINRYAAQYIAAQPDGALSDCVAYPSAAPAVWLVVACGPLCGPDRSEYHVNRLGWRVESGTPSCPDAALLRRAA